VAKKYSSHVINMLIALAGERGIVR